MPRKCNYSDDMTVPMIECGKIERNIGLSHKLFETFELFLETPILFVWETICEEKMLWFSKFPLSEEKNHERNNSFC